MLYDSRVSEESKMRSSDRIFKLEVIDGTKPKSSIGMVDPRLFKEGTEANRLHAIMDLETSLWTLKYDKGAIPSALEGRFTGFQKALDHARTYFATRNIQITQVKD